MIILHDSLSYAYNDLLARRARRIGANNQEKGVRNISNSMFRER